MKFSKVSSGVKFSYNITKGSASKRQENTRRISNDIFKAVSNMSDNEGIKVKDIISAMDNIMPESKPIKISTTKGNDLFTGANDYIEKNGQFVGQTLEIPLIRGRLPLGVIPVYMHELTHVLDILYNPKYTARTNAMERKHLYDTKYNKCFDKSLYRAETYSSLQEKKDLIERRRSEVKHWIAGKTPREKIDCIQETKNMLEMELHAFNAEKVYADLMRTMGINVPKEEFNNEAEEYLLEEKIQMLKELGKEIIKKERARHSKTLSINS